MRKITQTQLDNVIRLHGLWLRNQKGGVKANLSGFDLSGLNLSGADLTKSNMTDADMSKADLSGLNLSGVDLSESNLHGANMSGAIIDYQIEEGLLEKVAKAALASDEALNMRLWHTCETTHCIAGWACHLAANGKEMEEKYGPQVAGLLLLGEEAHSHFFDDNETAREWLKSKLGE